MLAHEGRAVARAWLAGHETRRTGFGGAFLTGSSALLAPFDPLPPWSDIDLVVVVSDAPPAKLGRVAYRGAVLDVSYLSWADLSSADAVAASFYLAPSFSEAVAGSGPDQGPAGQWVGGHVIADPTGRLDLLRRGVAPGFNRPEAVQRRLDDVTTGWHRPSTKPAPSATARCRSPVTSPLSAGRSPSTPHRPWWTRATTARPSSG